MSSEHATAMTFNWRIKYHTDTFAAHTDAFFKQHDFNEFAFDQPEIIN